MGIQVLENWAEFAYFEDPDGNLLYIIEIVERPQSEENSKVAYRGTW